MVIWEKTAVREQEFILYTTKENGLLEKISYLMNCVKEAQTKSDENRKLFHTCVKELLEVSYEYGFYGNIFHCFLAHSIVNDENAFSKSCEVTEKTMGNLMELAHHDLEIWKTCFSYDLHELDLYFGTKYADVLLSFEEHNFVGSRYPQIVVNRICRLAKQLSEAQSVDSFMAHVIEFYQSYGVGDIGLHMGFRIVHNDGKPYLQPVKKIEHIMLDDLVGYEIPKQKLIDNTEAFLAGKKANNCLLFGDAGTGKSSSIKGILNEYYGQGLRMIEVYKHQFKDLHDIIANIRTRNYKFIIYMDDLSFEEFEIEYKYLKAVIEGGLEDRADNVLIYATSNRRHLIRENFRDKEEYREDLHASDTVQEKLSLSARFGVSIYFGSPDRKEFQAIVKALAERYHIVKSEEELLLEANRWELSHGGLSGRTAQQFINYLVGKQEIEVE